jgi:YVTN family beta-propeller protein
MRLVAIPLAFTMASGVAWAYWTAGSTTGGNGAAAASSVNQGATPTATVAGANVTVNWAASTLASGQAVSGYTVKRYSGSTAQTIQTSCNGTITFTTCVENNVPTGIWTYSVTPVLANWVGVESPKSSNVVVGNVPPVAVADSYTVNEDTPLTLAATGVLGNDSDANSNPITAILTQGVANGALSFNANGDGGFTYTPNPNFSGSDSFSYKANDGTQDSNIVTVTLTVTAVNDAPVNAVPGPQQTPKNTSRVFSTGNNNLISISDADAGGSTVQVQLVSSNGATTTLFGTMPGSLSFSVGDGTADATMTFTGSIANVNTALNGLSFNPTSIFTGAATLQVVTSDLGSTGSGGTRTNSDTVTINVNSLGIFTANQNIGTGGPPLTDPVAATGSSAYSAGTYTVAGGGSDIYNTADHFQYLYRDLTGDGRLTARIVSELPAGTNAGAKTSVMFRESTAAGSKHAMMDIMQTAGSEFVYRAGTNGFSATTGTSNPVIAPYWVRITRVGDVITGQWSPNGVTWTTQGTPQTVAMTASIKVGLAVTAHNNAKVLTATYDNVALTTPPTAVADAYSVNEDGTLTVPAATGVLRNDTDPESDNLTAVNPSTPTHGTVTGFNANGSFTYTPTANYSGPDSFTYRSNDGVFDSNTVMVNLTVNPANEVPSFTKGANQSVSQVAGAQTVAGWATAISQGAGSESGQVVDFVVTNDNNGLFSSQPAISPTGILTYKPAGGTGSATVSVRIHDNGGTANQGTDTSAAQTFTITVATPTQTAYVANSASTSVTPVNVSTNTAGTAITGFTSPRGVAFTPDGTKAYVTNTTAVGTVSVITAGAIAATINVGSNPRGVAFTPDGTKAYVTNWTSGTVTPITVATNAPGAAITVGTNPSGVAFTPDGTKAYVTNNGTNTVSVITVATGAIAATITVGSGPTGVAFTPDGTKAYVANFSSNTVTPITVATNTAGTAINVGTQPFGLAITPDGAKAYVANYATGNVTPITVSNNTAGTAITAGTNPYNVAITPDGTKAYVTNFGSANVTPITVSNNTAGTAITVGTSPYGVAMVPDQGPTAALAAITDTAAGRPVSLDATASTGTTTAIATYTFDFGDASTPTTTASPTTTHTYTSAGSYTVTLTVTDTAGTSTTRVFTGQTVSRNGSAAATTTRAVTITAADTTGPAGGLVDASGLVGTGSRYASSTTLSLVLAKGTDASGVAATGATLKRATATLTGGTCGAFGTYTTVTGGTDPASPKSDTVTDQACFSYQYVVLDTLGNATTYTSPDIKVDLTAPAAPSLAHSAFTNTYWSSGAVVYYRSAASSGSFTTTSTATDTTSGIASHAFPALGTNWTSTPGALGVNTYSWSGAPAAPGATNVTATNNATGVSGTTSFIPTADDTAPSAGTVTPPNGTQSTTSVSVGYTTGTDGGSGLGTRLLQRQSATLTGTTCGGYGGWTTVATNPGSSPFADTVTAGNCYQYQYVVSDNVGNLHTASSANVVKVS